MRVTVSPRSPLLCLSGRWHTLSSSDSITASWSGSSVSFSFQGPALQLRTGSSTVRKDRFNGGTSMIACTVESTDKSHIFTYDADGSEDVTLIDEAFTSIHGFGPYLVRVTLIDWASVLEIQAFMVSSDENILPLLPSPRPSLKVLVIGDSIACGWTDGSQPMPLGCLDAFPYVLQRHVLRDAGIELRIDLTAFPGINLVDPTDDELDEGAMLGMASKFFHTSPWSTDIAKDLDVCENPDILLIALGTNDEAQDIPPKRYADDLQTFLLKLNHLYAHKIQHICFLPPFRDYGDCDDDDSPESITQCFSSMIDSLKQEPSLEAAGVGLHEIKLDISLHHRCLLDDLHPNVAGYELIGTALSKTMLPTLQSCIPKPEQ